jgi:hypothetical protein
MPKKSIETSLQELQTKAANECLFCVREILQDAKQKPLDFVGILHRCPGLQEASPKLATLIGVAQSLGKANFELTNEVD